jgi:hypothetical protein
MSEQIEPTTHDLSGWQQAVEDTSPYPDLHAKAVDHFERAKARVEISPEHHQAHIDIARPAVPSIDSLPAEEQDFVGEIIEIGEEALKDAEIIMAAPSESYVDPEKLNKRIGEALTTCEVEPSSEVHEAIKGFYEDHYSFAELIRKAVDGTLTSEECDLILDKNVGTIITSEDIESYKEIFTRRKPAVVELPSVNHASTLLAAVARDQLTNTDPMQSSALRKKTLQHVTTLINNLFQENALPSTTLNEKDYAVVEELFDKLADTATSEFPEAEIIDDGLAWKNGGGFTELASTSKDALISQIRETQDDFWKDTRMAGQLLYHNTGYLGDVSRNGGLMSRLEQKRRTNAMNATTAEADMGIHHSVVPHFSELYDPVLYKHGARYEVAPDPGTIAIPLINVIDVAPYARDAQYATVKTKDASVLERIPINHAIGDIGVGQKDVPGESGGDRVFFASPTEQGDIRPDEYIIKNGGNRTPGTRNTLIFIGDEEIASSPTYGLGMQFPDRLHIPAKDEAAKLIKELQDRYIQLNQGKIVVPLRRGVFDFIPEGMEWAPSYRAPQTGSYKLEA